MCKVSLEGAFPSPEKPMNRRKMPAPPKTRGPIPALTVFFSFLILQGIHTAPANAQADNITRGEFIAILARHQPENPLFPRDHAKLSDQDLYAQTAQTLKNSGFPVLDGKTPAVTLKEAEFVTLTYAFTGAPAGKSLLEQKLFLKDAGIVDSKDIGLATGVEGKVYQTAKGDNFKRRTQLASPVFLNDRIDTAVNSKVSYTFDDGSTLSLGENAKVNITKHIYDPEKNTRQTVINVSLGAVRFVVTKAKEKNSSFQVVTPVGIAGVRGTEFVVTVDKDGKTSFVVLEGTIETMPVLPDKKLGKPVPLTAGETRQLDKGGKVSETIPASKESLEKIKQETTPPATIEVNRGISRSRAVQAAIASKKFRTANKDKSYFREAPLEDPGSRETETMKASTPPALPPVKGAKNQATPPPAGGKQKSPGMVFKKSAGDAAREVKDAPLEAKKEAARAAKKIATKEVEKVTLEEAVNDAREEAQKLGAQEAEEAAKQLTKPQ